jgi:sporulation protein YlmC with PRC-barrel domain
MTRRKIMIKVLLTTTALAALLATGAYAQNTTTPTEPAPAAETAAPAAMATEAEDSLATNIMGESVYNGTGDEAQNIGKVSDIVFDKDGKVQSIVIGVGGFLGVGAKNVAFEYGKLQWAEKNGDRWLVAPTTKEELTAQQAFDATPYEPMPAPAPTGTKTAPADGTTAMAPTGQADEPAPGAATAPATGADTAQNTPAAPVQKSDGRLASNLIGESVYNGTGDNAENIGQVEDIVISKAGKADSLVIGVGGFLGVGAKHVAFNYDKAETVEENGDRWLVAEVNKEQLQALPDFDRKAYDVASAPSVAAGADTPATTKPATDETAENTTAPAATGNDTMAAGEASDAGTDPSMTAAIDKSALTPVPMGEIRSEDLVGTTVYGPNDDQVGEVGDVVLAPDKKVNAVIVDVGGFLGVGEKEVAMEMGDLKYMTDKDGNRYLYTSASKEQLEAQPAYSQSDNGSNAEKQPQQ